MTNARRIIPLLMLALVAGGLAVVGASRASDAQEPQAVPGNAAIWTDQSSYNVGDPINVCYRIPIAGEITISQFPPGNNPIYFQGQSSGTQGCIPGIVTPPTGNNCFRLSYPLFGGQGQTQACYQVMGNAPPPPGPLRIYTDSQYYTVGEAIDVCYKVPQPGPVTILDQVNEDTPTTFFSGYDDGTGGCIPGTIVPPTGRECLSIEFTYPSGQQITAQTCFQTAQ